MRKPNCQFTTTARGEDGIFYAIAIIDHTHVSLLSLRTTSYDQAIQNVYEWANASEDWSIAWHVAQVTIFDGTGFDLRDTLNQLLNNVKETI